MVAHLLTNYAATLTQKSHCIFSLKLTNGLGNGSCNSANTEMWEKLINLTEASEKNCGRMGAFTSTPSGIWKKKISIF